MQNSLKYRLRASYALVGENGVPPFALASILLTSVAVVIFLLWILYIKEPAASFNDKLLFLPALNAILNALSATCLILGVRAIRRGRPRVHMRFVLSACFFTVVFLISYITHHFLHGNTPFLGIWWAKIVYLAILLSHVLVAAITLPLILTTLYLAFMGKFHIHRRLARVTFPAWLYMSTTGILVFVLLEFFG